jgi:hypothetical protein
MVFILISASGMKNSFVLSCEDNSKHAAVLLIDGILTETVQVEYFGIVTELISVAGELIDELSGQINGVVVH